MPRSKRRSTRAFSTNACSRSAATEDKAEGMAAFIKRERGRGGDRLECSPFFEWLVCPREGEGHHRTAQFQTAG